MFPVKGWLGREDKGSSKSLRSAAESVSESGCLEGSSDAYHRRDL